MPKRTRWFRFATLGFLLIGLLGGGLVYLLLTGERGLSGGGARGRDFAPRPIEVTRLDPAATEALGWRRQGLDAVFDKAARFSSDALMIVTEGRIVASFGDLGQRYATHSVRKALLSALVGRYLGPGDTRIRLDATLADLGIDDAPGPLTALQKTATVRDLLRSVSGINHPAAAEAGLFAAEKQRRLGAGENPPGKIWAYNNWDYNALTTILEQRTGLSVAEAFQAGLAEPLGLRDFTPEAVRYIAEPALSRHRAAAFEMSARDLAKIGQLYLDRGRVAGAALLPADWVARIAAEHVATGDKKVLQAGHGYLWWIPAPESGLPEGSFWAWGLGQQALFVIPAWQTVIVHLSDTTAFRARFLPAISEPDADAEEILLDLILACLKGPNRNSDFCREDRFLRPRDLAELVSLISEARL